LGVWDSYNARLDAKGGSKRGARKQRVSGFLDRKLSSFLSYHLVTVNGEEQQLAIINSDHLDIKTICSLPGEDISGGSLVDWADNRWLVISRDAGNEVYTKAIITMQLFAALDCGGWRRYRNH